LKPVYATHTPDLEQRQGPLKLPDALLAESTDDGTKENSIFNIVDPPMVESIKKGPIPNQSV